MLWHSGASQFGHGIGGYLHFTALFEEQKLYGQTAQMLFVYRDSCGKPNRILLLFFETNVFAGSMVEVICVIICMSHLFRRVGLLF